MVLSVLPCGEECILAIKIWHLYRQSPPPSIRQNFEPSSLRSWTKASITVRMKTSGCAISSPKTSKAQLSAPQCAKQICLAAPGCFFSLGDWGQEQEQRMSWRSEKCIKMYIIWWESDHDLAKCCQRKCVWPKSMCVWLQWGSAPWSWKVWSCTAIANRHSSKWSELKWHNMSNGRKGESFTGGNTRMRQDPLYPIVPYFRGWDGMSP